MSSIIQQLAMARKGLRSLICLEGDAQAGGAAVSIGASGSLIHLNCK